MNYYWIVEEQRVIQLDTQLYNTWVDNGNPKANYYTPIPNPPGNDYYYDGNAWIQYPPPPPPPLTKIDFMKRFTDNELIGIEILRQTATDIQIRATLTVLKESWMVANDINISDPKTIQGIQILVSLGLLTSQRATEILEE